MILNSKLVLFVVLSLSISLVGNAYAHKSQVIDDYKIEVGWKYEPPTDGKRNYIELIVTKASDEDKASSMTDEDEDDMDHDGMTHDYNATKSDHDDHVGEDEHDHLGGISGLAKKLEVDVTLDNKKTHLKLHENIKNPGHYLATFTPYDEGFPSVHIFGKIFKSDVEATFHPEKIETKIRT